MERLRGMGRCARGVRERLLDAVAYIITSPYLPYFDVEAGGMPPSTGRAPKERKPAVMEESEQISEDL